MVDYRSHSQLSDYEDCPHKYYLKRIEKVWDRPAAWLPQGLAVHKAIEEIEKSGRTLNLEQAEEIYRNEYLSHTNRFLDETPNGEYWSSSGPYKGVESVRKGKVYPSDIERRLGLGLEQVGRYLEWIAAHPEETPWTTPDGKLAVEIGFDIDLDGVRVKGFIDNLTQINLPVGYVLRVRDAKSGKQPGSAFQLKLYSVAMKHQYAVDIDTGDYWMGPTGKPTEPYDLTLITEDEVTRRFHEVDEGIKAEKFDPKPSSEKCGRCSVNTSCPFVV